MNTRDFRQCPMCGKHYRFYNMTVKDQTCCPKCMAKIEAEADEQEEPRKDIPLPAWWPKIEPLLALSVRRDA